MATLPEVGDRVRMTGVMPDEPFPMEVGAEGTVISVTTTSFGTQIDVEWDNGRTLLLLDTDPFISF